MVSWGPAWLRFRLLFASFTKPIGKAMGAVPAVAKAGYADRTGVPRIGRRGVGVIAAGFATRRRYIGVVG
jgi:hypothetical protein